MAPPATPQYSLPQQPAGYRHRFHAMVKPIGSSCNLRCTYCYYLHKNSLLKTPAEARMSDEVLVQHVRQYIEAQTGDEVVFSWQGGEPTLLGLDFFTRVVELQAQYAKRGQRVENDLQTNGTLLDEEWARFLKAHNFLVGLSVDGPAGLHDLHRLERGGKPTHGRVMAAARLLARHRVPFSALCVVHRQNAGRPLDVYRHLTRELGTHRIQLIACVEPVSFCTTPPQYWEEAEQPEVGSERARPGSTHSVVTSWSVDPEEWGRFLCRVWDEWYKRDFGRVHVDLFESAIAQSLGMPAQRCITSEFCGKGLAIEHTGDVYCCDHYVYPQYHVGNIQQVHWGEMAYSERQQRFGFAKRNTLPEQCRRCEHLTLCWGECPKNRLLRTTDGEKGLNYLCPGLTMFFTHIQRDMAEICQRIRAANPAIR